MAAGRIAKVPKCCQALRAHNSVHRRRHLPVVTRCHGIVCIEGALHVCLICKPYHVHHISQCDTLRQQPEGTIDPQMLQVGFQGRPEAVNELGNA